jgi:integrase
MASLFKPVIIRYTLPNGSTRTPDGQRVDKSTPGAVKKKRKAKKWYGSYTDANGEPQRPPLSANKTVAQQMLNALVRKAELGKVGIVDPFEEHRKRPLAEHLTEWEASLLAGGATPKHVKQTVACARRVLDACGFVFIADLSASRAQQYLAGLRERRELLPLDPQKAAYTKAELTAALKIKPAALTVLIRRHRLAASGEGKARRYPRATAEALHSLRSRGRSIKTSNLYLDAIKHFAAWLVRDRRTADNPLAHLAGGNVKLDRRHDRRALPLVELRTVFKAAAESTRVFRGLSGPDRAILYAVAAASGFRAEELATLRPGAFDLDAEPPTVTLGAEDTKNGKTAVQPLPADVVKALRRYLAGRPADQPLWPGNWYTRAADMLRFELDACGIPYVVEGPDGPLYADFHALRHSYIALLDKSGATLKEAMQLARHSDPKLTMAVYGRAQLHDLGAAVDRLPGLLDDGPQRQALQATGTGGGDARCTGVAQKIDGERDGVRLAEAQDAGGEGNETGRKPLKVKAFEAGGDSVSLPERSSPRGTLFVTILSMLNSVSACRF